MPTWMAEALHYFSQPEVGLLSVFVIGFLSATLLPMATEPVLLAYIKLQPDQMMWAIVVATLGNTLGGMLTYYMGRGAHGLVARHQQTKRLAWLQKIGAPVLFFSWVPLLGDALCAMAGWIQLPVRPVLAWMLAGKLMRFVLMTMALMLVPDQFWWRFKEQVMRLV